MALLSRNYRIRCAQNRLMSLPILMISRSSRTLPNCGRWLSPIALMLSQREINLRTGYRFEWEVHVFSSPQINAFCLPGGKIGVFTGILKVVANDDQLATVLSHEIAHALAHHTSERIANREMNRGTWGLIRNRAFDREEESEADHIGLHYMARAGYNPESAVQFWERFSTAMGGKSSTPAFLRTHPVDSVRIADIKKYLFEAKQEYKPQP